MYFRAAINKLYRMYLLKIKGGGKIPNYLQIRDDSFTLIAYFKFDNVKSSLIKADMEAFVNPICEVVDTLEFGEIKYINNIK